MRERLLSQLLNLAVVQLTQHDRADQYQIKAFCEKKNV
jgi:hypothetical protein